jgi:N-acetyl-anhydromuramyl-L-alanine amidase AmpD
VDVIAHERSPVNVLPRPCTHFRRNRDGSPWLLVLHYGATFTAQATYDALQARRVSAHGTIDLNGDLWHHVDDEHTAWHAGDGTFAGSVDVNDDSLGYEIVNVGFGSSIPQGTDTKGWYIASSQRGRALTAYRVESYRDKKTGERKRTFVGISEPMRKYPDHRPDMRDKLWAAYTPQQLTTLLELQRRAMRKHRILPECVIGHEHSAPGRKSDPGPAFQPLWDALAEAYVTEAPGIDSRLLDPAHETKRRWKCVQSHLQRMGLYRLRIDGVLGDGTKKGLDLALEKYAGTYQLPSLDTSDPTWEICHALRKVPGFASPR